MLYYKEKTVKDGRTLVIRSCSAGDAREVHDIFLLTHGETENLLTYPDENTMGIEREAQFLSGKEASKTETELCAVLEGKIVGTAGVSAVGSWEKIKHRAEFGVSVEKTAGDSESDAN